MFLFGHRRLDGVKWIRSCDSLIRNLLSAILVNFVHPIESCQHIHFSFNPRLDA